MAIGYIHSPPGEDQKLVHVNFPFSRWISRSCAIRCIQKQEDALYVGLCSACSGGTVSIEKVKRDGNNGTQEEEEDDSSVPFKIDNEYATYEFHAEAIVNEDEMDDEDDDDDVGDEDYDPKDYIKEEEDLFDKKEFTCNICGLSCESKNSLTQHENIFHLNIKGHECGECGYRCSNLEDLKRHTDFECGNDNAEDKVGLGRRAGVSE